MGTVENRLPVGEDLRYQEYIKDQGTCLGPYKACKVPGWSNIRRNMEHKETLLGRLASGEVILGDGSYIMTLEKRGYATAGMWTPEACCGVCQSRGRHHADFHLL